MVPRISSLHHILGSICLIWVTDFACAIEVDYKLGLEQRQFLHEGTEPQQSQGQSSLLFEPQFLWYSESGTSQLKGHGFARYDSQDNDRSHLDIRELLWTKFSDDYELSLGVGKVFWGVTESAHLVDVINQTDLVEYPDGTEKLGQPMLRYTRILDEGLFELFLLPYFRQRTFPGNKGRLRSSIPVSSQYRIASGSNQQLDWAVRLTQNLGDTELDISHFQGVNREPDFELQGMRLLPVYNDMHQTGLALQTIKDSWIYKLEAIYRHSEQHFWSAVGGIEYTQVGAWGKRDLGYLLEYQTDRRKAHETAGQNDLFAGLRLSLNDTDSSEVLFGITQDLEFSDHRVWMLEAATRLNQSMNISINAWVFQGNDNRNFTHAFARDDFFQIKINYYFN